MTKTHFFGLNLRKHPLLAGLIWAALFVPAVLGIEWMIGNPIALSKIPKLVALAVPAGLVWGAIMSVFAARASDSDAC